MAGFLEFIMDPVERKRVALDALNAASRGITTNALGGLVDMAAAAANLGLAGYGYAGNKLGLLSADQMPSLIEKPVGGSEWIGEKMQQAGLLSGYRNPAAEAIAGGLLGPASAAAVQQRAPQIARGLLTVQDNAAAPQTIRNQGQRGMAYLPQDELVSILRRNVLENKGKKLGLRVLPDELPTPIVGEALPKSKQWINGDITKRELAGTSAASLGRGTEQEILKAITNLGLYGNGPNGYYFGKKIALIGGDSSHAGADVGEKVIKNAVALWVEDNPRYAKR